MKTRVWQKIGFEFLLSTPICLLVYFPLHIVIICIVFGNADLKKKTSSLTQLSNKLQIRLELCSFTARKRFLQYFLWLMLLILYLHQTLRQS